MEENEISEVLSEDFSDEIDANVTESEDETDEGYPGEGDTAELIEEDLTELRKEFDELQKISDITELPNPTRYAALRDLGLTPAEAYLATSPQRKSDTRSHLRGGVPTIARSPVSSMTRREWQIARTLFEDMTDSDIERLYRKVTK